MHCSCKIRGQYGPQDGDQLQLDILSGGYSIFFLKKTLQLTMTRSEQPVHIRWWSSFTILTRKWWPCHIYVLILIMIWSYCSGQSHWAVSQPVHWWICWCQVSSCVALVSLLCSCTFSSPFWAENCLNGNLLQQNYSEIGSRFGQASLYSLQPQLQYRCEGLCVVCFPRFVGIHQIDA